MVKLNGSVASCPVAMVMLMADVDCRFSKALPTRKVDREAGTEEETGVATRTTVEVVGTADRLTGVVGLMEEGVRLVTRAAEVEVEAIERELVTLLSTSTARNAISYEPDCNPTISQYNLIISLIFHNLAWTILTELYHMK
jgi:hypothetical protein